MEYMCQLHLSVSGSALSTQKSPHAGRGGGTYLPLQMYLLALSPKLLSACLVQANGLPLHHLGSSEKPLSGLVGGRQGSSEYFFQGSGPGTSLTGTIPQ